LDLTNPAELRQILKKYGLWAKKKFGQNFLVDRAVLEKIVATADLSEKDFVVEIGPGPGALTRELLPRTKKVFAVEIDREIIPVLKETTHFFRDKIEILNAHILGFEIPKRPYKIVANIPYHLTSPILRKFLVETNFRPKSLTLLVQKEVAEKICDPKKNSILSLFVAVFGRAKIVDLVSEKSFFPPPKVKSAILKIEIFQKPKIKILPKYFFAAAKMGFSQKRKKLKNTISTAILKKSEIDENLRPENLTIENWEKIARAIFEKEIEKSEKKG